jgi:Fe-S-cluster containining protein
MEENLWKNIFFNCFESFLNPDYVKPCILLNDILCSVYETRPFSCRMFGLYDRTEWEERLNSVKIETGLKEEDIPFYKQCEGISIKKRQNIKTIKKEVSDIIFKNIHQLDIDLFHKEDKENAYEIVMGSYTYIPFDAHFLLMKIGQEKLEDLALMKIRLRKLKEQDRLQYIKFKKEVDEFLLTLKAEIYK